MKSLRSNPARCFAGGCGSLLVLFLSGILAPAQPAAQPAAETFELLAVEGRVEVAPAGTTNWVPATANRILRPGDQLRTSKDSRALLQSARLGRVPIRESSLMTIAPPGAGPRRPVLDLLKGFFHFFNRDRPIEIELRSGVASAGTLGTEFQVAVAEDGRMEVTVFDGTVELRNDWGTLTLTNGQQGLSVPGRKPAPTATLATVNVIQWCLYYPAVLDVDELGLSDAEQTALKDSLIAWRSGDVLAALASYPEDRKAGSEREQIYRAALSLAVGETARAEALPRDPDSASPFAWALQRLVAAVKQEPADRKKSLTLASEWLAESYYRQSRAHIEPGALAEALTAARAAAAQSPHFGFAWERVAELEFSFGRTREALDALNKALNLSPRNAQALALKGFLLSAQNRMAPAIDFFNQAIAVDPALANGWLGRGLCRIRQGRSEEGRADLLTAAALEPQRAMLRSYLGKAFSDAGDDRHARQDLRLAQTLDPNDPTSWLYSALHDEQENRFNQAIGDLEKSKELNKNRRLYRSDFLLDQDRAVRNVNLARIYAEAGLSDVALREASRGVAADYGNFAAHLFLANSYEQLRQASPFDLRFETPAFGEYLLASLMGPADGRMLAQPVSQQEYTRLFERDTLGVSTSTEYLSRGAWSQYGAQYGTFRNSSYALEADYRWDPGQTPNGSVETRQFSFKFKQMITPNDGLLVQAFDFRRSGGDLAQRYDPNQAEPGLQFHEKQEPSVLVGLDHQWSDTQRTLLLVSRFDSSLQQTNPHGPVYLLTSTFGTPDGFVLQDLSQNYLNRLTVDSVELQHLVRSERLQTIAGVRVQTSTDRLSDLQTLGADNSLAYAQYFGSEGDVVSQQSLRLHSLRISPYLYEHWRVASPLWLIGGVAYDYQSQPRNVLFAPLTESNEIHRQVSPKAALVWTPTPRATLRAAYSRSLAGFDLDQSVRLEPTQLAGFVQAYRNLFPDSLVGGIGGAHFETADASVEYNFPGGTYTALSGQWLRSRVNHDVGAYQNDLFGGASPTALQIDERLRFQERSLQASIHQLLGDWFSVGVAYRLSNARLAQQYPQIDPALGTTSTTSRGLLQSVKVDGVFQHPSGFFAGTETLWWSQTLRGDLSGIPGDNFWQENLTVGYRSKRRVAEFAVGVLNVTGTDYRLHPINLYPDLPRRRTLFARVQLNF